MSVYSPSFKPEGSKMISRDGSFTTSISASSFVTLPPSEAVRVMPTEASVPATFMFFPRTVKLRPAVAERLVARVAASNVPLMYIVACRSPKICTVVSLISSRNFFPCVSDTYIEFFSGFHALPSASPLSCGTARKRSVLTLYPFITSSEITS